MVIRKKNLLLGFMTKKEWTFSILSRLSYKIKCVYTYLYVEIYLNKMYSVYIFAYSLYNRWWFFSFFFLNYRRIAIIIHLSFLFTHLFCYALFSVLLLSIRDCVRCFLFYIGDIFCWLVACTI